MDTKYDHKAVEPKIREFWEKERVFAFDPESKKPVYSIDAPPLPYSGVVVAGLVILNLPRLASRMTIVKTWLGYGGPKFNNVGFVLAVVRYLAAVTRPVIATS